ncbi:MAG TPA: tetratricopeptide repeat protein [Bacteroidetes bacterium]|nr:tetratricopeptide repeat protein [Bacteroidota bacterium]
MKTFISITISLLFALSLQAQPLNKYTFESLVEAADMSFEKGDYSNAVEYFKQAFDEKNDPNLTLRIAESYYMLRDYKHAKRYLKSLLRKDKTGMFFDAKLLYAKCMKRLGEYQDAYNEFKDFAKNTDDPDMRKEAMLEVQGLELLNSLPENLEMEFTPLDKTINKGFSLYGIQRRNSNDTIYIGSFDSKTKIVLDGKSNEVKSNSKSKKRKKKSKKDKSDGGKRAMIMVSNRNKEGKYDKPKALDKRINRIESYSIYPAFTEDGNTMYFTRAILKGTEVLESKIFVTYDKGGEWSAPQEVPAVNGDFISKMPAVGEILGQQALFFVSDMEGGEGGFDIYYSLINSDGTMEIPVNLGKKINTIDDEITPYFVDGKLYYSTNGLPGLGGFDIYMSKWDGKEWSDPENAGKGYNSTVDDLGLSISADGRSGFLLSNRPYKGKKKILSETCCNHAFKISARDLIIKLLVTVFDEKGKLNDAKVQLVDLSKVKPTPPETKSNFSDNTFNFVLDSDKPYKAIVTKDGYDPGIVKFNTAGIFDDYTIEKKVTLKKAKPEMEVITINQPIRLGNIYYDYDDYKILPEAEKDLEKLLDLMNEYPEMVIELSSHTDSRGTKKYNIKLSQKRAESAKNWLVENGIDAKRIIAKGYGESQILNKCVDGVKCTEEEHRFNRRTEFKIIKGPKEITIKKQVFKKKKEE